MSIEGVGSPNSGAIPPALTTNGTPESSTSMAALSMTERLGVALKNVILAVNYAASESARPDAASSSLGSGAGLPAFPQTSLRKLNLLLEAFPLPPLFPFSSSSFAFGFPALPIAPSTESTPSPAVDFSQHPRLLLELLLFLHPRMVDADRNAWKVLLEMCESEGLGRLDLGGKTGSEALAMELQSKNEYGLGLMGYRVDHIERLSSSNAKIIFESTLQPSFFIERTVPSGILPFAPLPSSSKPSTDITPTPRFLSLLATFLQLHALSLDITYVPPSSNSTASCSTTTLIRTFADILGYELESIYLWKEMGGRELLMRRVVDEGEEKGKGGTKWVARSVYPFLDDTSKTDDTYCS
jgi:hypothetical protein